MSDILPDCMMPDGGDCCIAFQKLQARIEELETDGRRVVVLNDVLADENAQLKARIEKLEDLLEDAVEDIDLYETLVNNRRKALKNE